MWIAEAEGVGLRPRQSRENAAQGDARGQVDPNYAEVIPGRENGFSGRDNGENA